MSLAWVWSQYKACLSETDDLKTHPENISQPTAWIWSQYRGVQGETSQTLPILADEISLAWVWSVFKGVNIAYDDSNVTGTPKLSSSPSIDAAHLEINATSTPSVVTSLLFYLGLIALSFYSLCSAKLITRRPLCLIQRARVTTPYAHSRQIPILLRSFMCKN